jgi:excisionase family DNA binding protein|tara:strand:- start:262 stop:486 length:225 start_codon:yes stop_codon:yes gene_type:complete
MEQEVEIERMMTVREIADIMGYSLQTVRKIISDGGFDRVHRFRKPNGRMGHTRIYVSDFERWREENTDHVFQEE